MATDKNNIFNLLNNKTANGFCGITNREEANRIAKRTQCIVQLVCISFYLHFWL
jgi:hypothetical protein